jgi:5-formyltetrahydrofolate cyclo-ligase
MDVVQHEKETIRAIARERRAATGASELRRISDEISTRVNALPEILGARVVHSYMPMLERGEIDSRPIIQAQLDRGVRIILPVVRTFDNADVRLEHVEWDGSSLLVQNRWGVDEPVGTSFRPLSEIDVIIVPLLAADVHGNRIGHGRGYYDAFLRHAQALTIGLAMDSAIFDSIPTEPHDVPLSMIVSETRILKRT